jgi:hypothetical protein
MSGVARRLSLKAEHVLAERSPFALHGAKVLPQVEVTSYNLEISEKDEFVGDRANKQSLQELVEKWRKIVKQNGYDPLAKVSRKKKVSKSAMERVLAKGKPEAAGVIQLALSDFAKRLAEVIEKYLSEVTEWRQVKVIVIGGGLSASKIGKLAIGRTQALLARKKRKVSLRTIKSDPDDAALVGSLYLIPGWFLAGFNASLAVDIGGTNVRVGIVKFKLGRRHQISKAEVVFRKHWGHAKEGASKEQILEFMIKRLRQAVKWSAGHKLRLAPFVGVACPGRIRADGTVDRGAQNLPGKWESEAFCLPKYVREKLTIIPGQDTVVVMHNDAVVQGLSELSRIHARNWAVLTIGTGLGNSSFKLREWVGQAKS